MMMASSSSFWPSACPPVSSAAASSSILPIKPLLSSPRTSFSWSLQNRHLDNTILQRSDRQAVLVFANAPQRKGSSSNEVMMVDPLEAKRLAAKQMQEIQAKEKHKRRRQAEAINGAWAMIGLTAGLVVEGHTGKGILDQLAGYFSAIISFFIR
ncbi:uncharacterized protein LOC103699445 isoform X2 [Phoenix dactylifera]|uniref:Uncharacterized protein LOC103699445 isoform X2 n=1 Tax=Phoenix dactylifera TaxID=42345 RepID=A0A8B8J1C7_PHODC|nr:uncharacterized protein LOC103699445 isoform X2 [Phoenix dactylifera]